MACVGRFLSLCLDLLKMQDHAVVSTVCFFCQRLPALSITWSQRGGNHAFPLMWTLVFKKPVQQRLTFCSVVSWHAGLGQTGAWGEVPEWGRPTQANFSGCPWDLLEGAQHFSARERSSGGIFDLFKESPRAVQVLSYWLSQKSSLPGGPPVLVASFSVPYPLVTCCS